jgi:hypothetical protein
MTPGNDYKDGYANGQRDATLEDVRADIAKLDGKIEGMMKNCRTQCDRVAGLNTRVSLSAGGALLAFGVMVTWLFYLTFKGGQ